MPKIKLTKTELKAQQDALKQYRRFLPTLQLKKQQLQMEIRRSSEMLEANLAEQAELKAELRGCLALFGDPALTDYLRSAVKIIEVKCGTGNIAGVTVPVFDEVRFAPVEYDFFATDWSWDDAVRHTESAVRLRIAYRILEEQYRLLSKELRTTTQRVNLFEKVKIPECQSAIRSIRIHLTDQDTASVVRSKIAKRKTQEAVA